jgi:hypothetical protein
MESTDVLKQNLTIARGFKPYSADQIQHLRERCCFHGSDRRLELFKSTKKYDSDLGREQHGFPLISELPL